MTKAQIKRRGKRARQKARKAQEESIFSRQTYADGTTRLQAGKFVIYVNQNFMKELDQALEAMR
jgi:hypothetical protein